MLPIDFELRMKELLKEEYDDFIRSYDMPEFKALRLNPLKVDNAMSDYLKELISDKDRVEWEELGYYYDAEAEDGFRPGKHPYHVAGVFYIQEPSAMKPVTKLDPRPGETVLDLCAAPGGKTTQIAGRMKGEGLLICNEIVNSRAKILSENIERMGVRNAIVLNETPDKLSERFVDYFDKILVDAPCSGEGMFRKNEAAQSEWSVDNVKMCAERQKDILNCVATMLKPGGTLCYSTCTFSREEDEECMQWFVSEHSDYTLIEEERLFPHKVRGEGHYLAVLRRKTLSEAGDYHGNSRVLEAKGTTLRDALKGNVKSKKRGNDTRLDELRKFFDEYITSSLSESERVLEFFGDNLYLLPEGAPMLTGLKVMRPGLALGSYVKDRFEPAHALALSLRPEEFRNVAKLSCKDSREAADYILGMTFPYEGEKGYYLVCVDGYSLGFGKLAGGIMKNHYPKGLRKQL